MRKRPDSPRGCFRCGSRTHVPSGDAIIFVSRNSQRRRCRPTVLAARVPSLNQARGQLCLSITVRRHHKPRFQSSIPCRPSRSNSSDSADVQHFIYCTYVHIDREVSTVLCRVFVQHREQTAWLASTCLFSTERPNFICPQLMARFRCAPHHNKLSSSVTV